MSTFFSCPNPACSYQFDASQLPPAAIVTCPLCGMRFTYQAQPQFQAQTPVPPQSMPPAPQVAQSAPPMQPAANPWATPAAAAPAPAPSPADPWTASVAPAGGFPMPAPAMGYLPTPPMPTAAQPYAPAAPSYGPSGYPTSSPHGYGIASTPVYPSGMMTPGQPEFGLPASGSPMAPAVATPPAPAPREKPVVQRVAPRGDGGQMLLMIGLFFVMCSVGIVAVVSHLKRNRTVDDRPGPRESVEFNFSFVVPGDPWIRDNKVRGALEINIVALTRPTPNAWLALAAIDYRDREPRESELRTELTNRLRKCFESLEPEPITNATLAGKPAFGIRFTGKMREEHAPENALGEFMLGEALTMSHQGIGYWYFMWAPQKSYGSVKTELEEIRSKFKVLNHRNTWKPKKGQTRTFTFPDSDVKIQDSEEFWQENEGFNPAEEYNEPTAKFGLYGYRRSNRGRDRSRPDATLIGLEINGSGNPLEKVKAKLDEILQKEDMVSETKTMLQEAKDKPAEAIPAGASVLRFDASNDKDRAKSFRYVVSAIEKNGKIYGVIAWCKLVHVEELEGMLLATAVSLR